MIIVKNITTRVEIGIFRIPIAYWSGFGIFKQTRDNPDEIGMVGKSVIFRSTFETKLLHSRRLDPRRGDWNDSFRPRSPRSCQSPLPDSYPVAFRRRKRGDAEDFGKEMRGAQRVIRRTNSGKGACLSPSFAQSFACP